MSLLSPLHVPRLMWGESGVVAVVLNTVVVVAA